MTRITLPPCPLPIPPAPRDRSRATPVRILGDTAQRGGISYGQRQSVDRLIAGQDYARRLEGLGASEAAQ